jgi:gamma-glutamyltranspeptidase/glutathione hydrolase
MDAAIAAAFTLAVVTPSSTGVAGYGGSLVAHLAGSPDVVAIDFTSRAPRAARADMFPVEEDPSGRFAVPGAGNAFGGLAVDVPGIAGGLVMAQERYGVLPLGAVMAPAIDAARRGFPLDPWTIDKLRETLVPNGDRFPQTLRLFSIDGRAPVPGETLSIPELAETLEAIAAGGAPAFYRGPIAHAIVETVRGAGGVLTRDDLAAYTPVVCKPLAAEYRGYDVLTPPLPCGGLTILQMLRVLEELDPAGDGTDVGLAHLLVEVAKACWRERLTKYGDPDQVAVDPAVELGEPLIADLRKRVRDGLRRPSPGELIAPDPLGVGTVHVCTADAAGNIVSLTETHGGNFGSLLSVPGTGLVLGHGMGRFDPRPGRPNSVAPWKRPLHNMAPLLVLRGGRPVLALGGAGGRTIINNLCQVLVRLVDLGETPTAAIGAARVHVETAEPVRVEEGGEAIVAGLERLGHAVQIRPRFGALQAIRVGPGEHQMSGAADLRRAGTVTHA